MTRAPYDARRRPEPRGVGSLTDRERDGLILDGDQAYTPKEWKAELQRRRRPLRGRAAYGPRIARPDPSGMASLSPQEREVLRSVARHGAYKLVALEMGIAYQTVKNHATHVFRKLGLGSIVQAAVLFDRAERTCRCDCGCRLDMSGVCAFCEVGDHR